MITTVIGAEGFIGRHIIDELNQNKLSYFAPKRNDHSVFVKPLGHVIYCAGVTSDFRNRPFDTVRAHVSFLSELLERADFESFLYLSSTRVYFHQKDHDLCSENANILVNSLHPEELFNLTKLTGESLCITVNKPNVRVARVSNVCGYDFESNNFIYSIIKDAVHTGNIILHSTYESEKDYISVEDVAKLLLRISHEGKSKLYNVASGRNITNKEIIDQIIASTGCSVGISSNARTIKFPPINTSILSNEFGFVPMDSLDMISDLINYYKKHVEA